MCQGGAVLPTQQQLMIEREKTGGGFHLHMYTVAQTALAFYDAEQRVMPIEIYLMIACAIALCDLGRLGEAKRYLLDAMNIALPLGFITPFAESATYFRGLLEQALEQEFPEYYDATVKQWEWTVKNWIAFHNQFTKDNITQILSLRDYQIARLVTLDVPYEQIARQYNLTLGTLKNRMQVIYEQLLITGKNRKQELAKYIL